MSGRHRSTMDVNQVTKPLPQLPRDWSRVCHETGILLRSIGLGIVVTAFQGFFITKNFAEPQKIAIRRNRITSLLRTLIHLLPLGVAFSEIFLNWKGHYVGRNFEKQTYFQFAAKAYEITIHASIATILFSYIRYEIIFNDGIPFGAVLGGLQFFQPSYLWSVEFWSSILCKRFQFKKKLCFLVLISTCVVLAATAGLSSANLLIARQGLWPINPVYLTLNATFQDIWPDRLDADKILKNCPATASSTEGCPFFPNLSEFNRNILGVNETRLSGDTLNTFTFSYANYVNSIQIASCYESRIIQMCATILQAAVLPGFVSNSWSMAGKYSMVALDQYQVIKNDYYQPYTVASCVSDVHNNGSDQTPLRFAPISENSYESDEDQETVQVLNLTERQAVNSLDDSQFRVGWVELPQNIFNTKVPGIVIAHPQNPTDLSHNVTTCTLNAGWGSTALMGDDMKKGELHSDMDKIPSSWPVRTTFSDSYGFVTDSFPRFATNLNFSYPQRRISISKGWMESLNPTVILPENSSMAALPFLLSQLPQPDIYNIEYMLNMLLVIMLSNSGVEHEWKVFDSLTNATTAFNNGLVFKIEQSIYGWCYIAEATMTRLAIAVMVTYCILVFGHVIYSAISGVSSSAWDTIGERRWAQSVPDQRQSAANNRQASGTGFGDIKHANADTFKVVVNEKYGSLIIAEKHDGGTLKVEKDE